MIQQPYPDLDALLQTIGDAGRHMSEIEATEGAAGNISICARWPLGIQTRFPEGESYSLPEPMPELGGATFIVTGSGRRLRELGSDPEANLGGVVIDPGGQTAQLYTSSRHRFSRLSSDFSSHLAVHRDQIVASGTDFHAVVHAQPPYLTYLSHIPAYQDEVHLNRQLLRWQPETIIQFPEGIGVLPFRVPGSEELVAATLECSKRHHLIVWSRHGAFARSDSSLKHAADLIEYAEAAAHYEYLNLQLNEPSDGLSAKEIRAICKSLNIDQNIF